MVKKDFFKLRRLIVILIIYGFAISPLLFYFLPSQAYQIEAGKLFKLNPPLVIENITTLLGSTFTLISFQFSGSPWTIVPDWIIAVIITVLIIGYI